MNDSEGRDSTMFIPTKTNREIENEGAFSVNEAKIPAIMLT